MCDRSSKPGLKDGEAVSGLVSQEPVLCSEVAMVVVILGGTGSSSSSSRSEPSGMSDPAEDAVQVPFHVHQGAGVVHEALAHLLQPHAGQIVEVQKHLVGFLEAVQHVLLGQNYGVDVISVHHAEEAATEDP